MYTTTLLYNQDYSRFSGIIDYKTSNLSFLRMVKILKELNVKNRYFFLYLSQPELQGVDPYDPSLDEINTYGNQPIAIRKLTDSNKCYLFSFPLSFMKADQAKIMFNQIMSEIETTIEN